MQQGDCPSCRVCFSTQEFHHARPAGSWMEFGVWEGRTLNGVAEYRKSNCDTDADSGFVYGFDTFTGLPEAWGEFRPSVRFLAVTCKNKRPTVPLLCKSCSPCCLRQRIPSACTIIIQNASIRADCSRLLHWPHTSFLQLLPPL